MASQHSLADVQASFEAFRNYLAGYSVSLDELAPEMRVEVAGEAATVVGVPEVDGVTTLDFTKRKLTKRLPLPLGLVCEALLCSGTMVSGIDNLPETLRTLDLSNNRRFKRWPSGLPSGLETLDVSVTKLTEVGPCPEGLQTLNCERCDIETIAALPSSLTSLLCRANHLSSLPELPEGLEVLNARGNPIVDLPPLPASLRSLDVATKLEVPVLAPNLPHGLTDLSWNHDGPVSGQLELPETLRTLSITLSEPVALPQSLTTLSLELIADTVITDVPDSIESLYFRGSSPLPSPLPSSLKRLSCGWTGLREIPPLPANLKELSCSNNELRRLPDLPDGLEVLWCPENNLDELPELPDTLREFNCADNDLTRLPELSVSLEKLWCNGNQLIELPRLDRWWDTVDTSRGYLTEQGLRSIECQDNELTSMPPLPKGLDRLRCQRNNITSMPSIPISTKILNCSHNRITKLIDLPPKINELYCNNNPGLRLIDTYESEAFDRLHKSNATATALSEEEKERMRLWRVRVD